MSRKMTVTPPMLLLLLLASLIFWCEARKPSLEEHREMKKYLQFINRPGVKTITNSLGEVFYCVDILKQPAFDDHSLLKNHTVQMEPSFLLNRTEKIKDPAEIATKMGFSNGGCVLGTVPLRSFHLKDLVRAGSVSRFTKKQQRTGPDNRFSQSQVHEYAAERLTGGPFFGTEVVLSVWNPQPNPATGAAFSLAQLWITSEPSTPLNTIEVGWQVYPDLYGNYATRLFTFWTNNGYQTGCYNLRCPGFVQVSSVIVPEMILPVSVPGGPIVDIQLDVIRDANTGNWWLIYREASVGQVEVGYWPGSLFTYLGQYATSLTWGGEIATIVGGSYPPMGSGSFPGGPGTPAIARDILYMDANGLFFDAPLGLTLIQTKPSCYQLRDGYDLGNWRRYFGFGGPGGLACNGLITSHHELPTTATDQ